MPFIVTGGASLIDVRPASPLAIDQTAAHVVGVAGTYPTLFAGGETMTIDVDGGGPTPVVFAAGDQTLADVILAINTALGAAIASDEGGELALTSPTLGPTSSIGLAETVGTPLATLGLVAGATTGTDTFHDQALAGAAVERYTVPNAVILTGIVPQGDGRFVWILNAGPATLTLAHEDAGSAAPNRFHLQAAAPRVLAADGVCLLWYDGAISRWRDFV